MGQLTSQTKRAKAAKPAKMAAFTLEVLAVPAETEVKGLDVAMPLSVLLTVIEPKVLNVEAVQPPVSGMLVLLYLPVVEREAELLVETTVTVMVVVSGVQGSLIATVWVGFAE